MTNLSAEAQAALLKIVAKAIANQVLREAAKAEGKPIE